MLGPSRTPNPKFQKRYSQNEKYQIKYQISNATHSDFLIQKSLQPKVVDLRYFKQ